MAAVHEYAFGNGRLCCSNRRRTLIVYPWPEPYAWFQERACSWQTTWRVADWIFSEQFNLFLGHEYGVCKRIKPDTLPTGQYLLPGVDGQGGIYRIADNGYREAMRRYFESIPTDIRAAVLRYRKGRWPVLCLLARCPGAMDLSVSNPALLYALAHYPAFCSSSRLPPVRVARWLINKKQRHILEWLGFPGTEAMRRIFSRIQPEAVVDGSLEVLRYHSEPFVIKHLSHLERINAGALLLALGKISRHVVTPRLLHDVSVDMMQDNFPPPVMSLFSDIDQMANYIGKSKWPCQISSLKRLVEIHDELCQRFNEFHVKDWEDLPERFPDPPYAGTNNIIPIETPSDLICEGREMNHCVGTHVGLVTNGNEYVYRVFSPVRATLSISKIRDEWMPNQLFMEHNHPVEENTRDSIIHELFSSSRLESGDKRDTATTDLHQLPLLPSDDLTICRKWISAFCDAPEMKE